MHFVRFIKNHPELRFTWPVVSAVDRFLNVRKKMIAVRQIQSWSISVGVHQKIDLILTAIVESRSLGSMNSAAACKDVAAIEHERKEFLKNNSPLVDGTEQESGPYDDGVTVADACKVSKPPNACRFLYALTNKIAAKSILELGTNIGISSSFLAASQQDTISTSSLITMEASPYRLNQAKELHAKLRLDHVRYVQGLFVETLPSLLERESGFDLVFVDGHHQYKPTLDYFDQISVNCMPGAIIVFDDIRWSDGMHRAWTELCSDERFSVLIDLGSVGVGILRDASSPGTRPLVAPLVCRL